MEKQELKRYHRQIILEEIGIKGQQSLLDASVLVIGAGGLGCPLLLYLSAAGVGKIGIIDDDIIEESNLQRQVLYQEKDLGKPKASCAAQRLSELNSQLVITPYTTRLDKRNAELIFAEYELIIDGSDNFETRYLVNDTCVLLGKPFISGSIFRFEGQVSTFNLDGGPTYRDCFPEAPEEASSCAETGVIGALAGMIGSIMAQEAIKVICRTGSSLSGRLMILDSLHMDIQQYDISPPETLTKKASPRKPSAQRQQTTQQQQIAGQSSEIQLEELQSWRLGNENFQLIDVREPYEFEEYNIGGTNVPLYELHDLMETLPLDKTLVFACKNGSRSRIAAKLATEKTKQKVFTIKI